MELYSHHYDGTILFAPKVEEPYFASYRKVFANERFDVYTYEDVLELFTFPCSNEAGDYLESIGVNRDLLPYLRRITAQSYKSAELQRYLPLVQELRSRGLFQKEADSAAIFCGRVLTIRGYYSGKMFAEALQDLPNISLNWDFGRPVLNEKELPQIQVQGLEEAMKVLLAKLDGLKGESVYLRYEGNKVLTEPLAKLPRIQGSFIPYGAKVLYLETDAPKEMGVRPFSKQALAELHVPTLEEEASRRLHDEQCFLRHPSLCARVYDILN